MKFILLFALALMIPIESVRADDAITAISNNDDWVNMPAGAKPAYVGIHGGTMPISLLVSDDGSSLLSFAGRTGNDFLQTLRKTSFLFPSFGNSTLPHASFVKTDLFAGNATASLPVFAAVNTSEEEWLKNLSPFGFSPTPLAIEGKPDFPERPSRGRKYRHLYLPGAINLKR